MNYPIWEVPLLGGTWLIGLMSCLHIVVSHFAVGGGIYFAITEWLAHKRNDARMYSYLKSHSKFFLMLTTVFGAVTGVGIWWTISLVNPDGIASLIQNYTMGWATEYIFFVAELATVFVYYYTWDKATKAEHLSLARWYAVQSVLTLVIINGILSYMLTPGQWLETGNWLHGFFNPTYWPSLIMRLLVMAAIAGMYALVTASRIQDEAFRHQMLRYSAKWFLPVFFIGPIAAGWFLLNVPGDVLHTLMNGLQASGVGNYSIMARVLYLSLFFSGTLLIFAFVGPYLNPKGFSFRMACVFLLCGMLVTTTGEWAREMLRKPYVIYNYLYSNGLRKPDIAVVNAEGFVAKTPWLAKDAHGLALGKAMFQGQCMSCHTEKRGYRAMAPLLGERNEKSIRTFLATLHQTDKAKNPYLGIMPPVVGTEPELDALAQYLATLNAKPMREKTVALKP